MLLLLTALDIFRLIKSKSFSQTKFDMRFKLADMFVIKHFICYAHYLK